MDKGKAPSALEVRIFNACATCQAAEKTSSYLFTEQTHDPSSCCLRCRDFSVADKWATRPDAELKFLKYRDILNLRQTNLWIKTLADTLTQKVVSKTEKA